MQKRALSMALEKAKQTPSVLDFLFAGDLLNQCISAGYAARGTGIPFFRSVRSLLHHGRVVGIGALLLDGEFGEWGAAVTSSHFCSAERQYRTPLEYGGQRTPTSQWTATAAGAVVLAKNRDGPYITHVTQAASRTKGSKMPTIWAPLWPGPPTTPSLNT